jgi:quinol monooxygenase YgiN
MQMDMLSESIVMLHAKATVNARDWQAFKEMVAETREVVKKEGPQSVLTHECYYNPITFECLIIEAYASEAALLTHLEMIKPVSEKFNVDWKITRLELFGKYSKDLIGVMQQAVDNHSFNHYPSLLLA